MSWSVMTRALVLTPVIACTSGPQAAASRPVAQVEPVVAAEPVVAEPVVAEPVAAAAGVDLRARLCGERAPCAVRRTRAAGVAADGQALAVVSVELGAGDGADVADGGLTEEAWADSFSAPMGGRCRAIEYWLVVGDPGAPTASAPLLHVCNDGNGAAGLGEDMVTIGDNSLEHASSGGSNWRWSRTRRLQLAPLRVRDVVFDGSFVMGPNREQGRWSFEQFAGASGWYSPPCARETAEPEAVPEAAQVDFGYSAIPAVAVDEAFTAGWQQLGLGRCALTLASAERPADATMRVVAAGPTTLYVEIEDDQLTRGDAVELWLADAGASYMDHCLAGEPAGLRQWVIGASDGRVRAGFGRPDPEGLAVERGGPGPVRLRLTPRAGFAALTVVYVDHDAGESTPRRLASSELVPGRRETLGRLETLDPQAASCAVVAGRLEPVLHAFTGPGPALR